MTVKKSARTNRPHAARCSAFWVFPCGGEARIGVASYVGETKLKDELEKFMRELGVGMDGLHGGYFPYALREPTVGNLFVVGDAAGQCFGVTGEGIRGALYFGQAAGRIARRIVDGELSRAQGLAEYRRFVQSHRVQFAITYWVQKIFSNAPSPLADLILRFFRLPIVLPVAIHLYVTALNPARLRPVPDADGVRALSVSRVRHTAR